VKELIERANEFLSVVRRYLQSGEGPQ